MKKILFSVGVAAAFLFAPHMYANVVCSQNYIPVCGQLPAPGGCMDGRCPVAPAPQTYDNECLMNAAGATLVNFGACGSNGGNNAVTPVPPIGTLPPTNVTPTPPTVITPPANSGTPADIVLWAYNNGLTKYNTVATFGWDRTISRQEAAAIASRFAIDVLGRQVMLCDLSYTDADQIDVNLGVAVFNACGLGLMKGSNGKFAPRSLLTESEALAVVMRAAEGKPLAENVNPWYTNYRNLARSLGLTVSSGNLDIPVSRGTYIKWIWELAPQYQAVQPFGNA